MAKAVAGKRGRVRILGWGTAVALLASPFVAMRFTSDVNWSAGDFIFAGLLFATIGGLLELAVRLSGNAWYRAGVALALLATLLVIWVNLAVGIVGSENNPANRWFFAALLIGIAGASIARFRAQGMVLAMTAAAASLGIAFVIASLGATDEPNVKQVVELAGTSVFAAIFLVSAWLFRKAAQSSPSSSS